MRKLEPHKTEVVEIKIDNYNKLYISGGLDSQLKVQRLTESQDKEEPLSNMNDRLTN